MMLSTVEKVDFGDDEYTQLEATLTEKLNELQVRFLDKYIQELENIDVDSFNKEEITEIFDKYDDICELCDDKNAEEGKKQLREALQKKVEEKIQLLDKKLNGLKEHIEIPENEDKINELQGEIEELEDILVDFKARQDFKENWKLEKFWDKYQYHNEKQGYSVSITEGDRIQERYKEDYRRIHNHRELRIQEQGKYTSDIMKDIASYRDNGRGTDDYNFTIRNSEVARKIQYLEGKLTVLRQHEDIEGNSERISQIEQELESMQDAWVVAKRGFNNIDANIQNANEQIQLIQGRLVQYQEELKKMAYGTKEYDQKSKQIERASGDIKIYQDRIDKLTQTKEEIEEGKNPTFMGEHHRDRYMHEQEAKAKAEQEARAKAEQEAKLKISKQPQIVGVPTSSNKVYEENQPELIKPQEESFRDQIGDDLQKENENKKMQLRKNPTIEMWMNRFGSWYSAIDRVSQNVKSKFIQMKSEIVNAIKNKIQERENKKEQIEQQNKEVEEEGR